MTSTSEIKQALGGDARPPGTEQGATELMESLGLGQDAVEAAENTAHTLYNYAHYEEAEQVLEGVLVLDDERHYPHLLLGDIAYREGEYDRARRHFEAALELKPDDLPTLSKLGEACVRQGDDERAREVLEVAIDHANQFSHHKRRAEVLIRQVN